MPPATRIKALQLFVKKNYRPDPVCGAHVPGLLWRERWGGALERNGFRFE
jgi:hypothetical protein